MYGLAFTLFFLGLVTLVFYANGNLVGAAICGLLFIGTVNVGFFAIRRQVKGVIGNNPRKYDR
jgi:hypothetical protein